MTKEPIEEVRPDKLTAEEAVKLVLKRPGMYGLTRTDEFRKVEAERDAALAAVERVAKLHFEDELHTGYCAECSDFGNDDHPMLALVDWPCDTRAALDGAPEPGLSESERLEVEGAPYVFSPDSLSYQLDGWVNDLGLPGNSLLEEIGVQEGVYYADQSVLSEKLQEVTIAWLESHGYRRAGAPEPEWEWGVSDQQFDHSPIRWLPLPGRSEAYIRELASSGVRQVARRRKAGPWLPVEGEKP